MRYRILSLPLLLLPLAAQDSGPAPARGSHPAHLVLEAHQVTPGEGLRDANSRSGWGVMIGFEGGNVRVVAEGGLIPAQAGIYNGQPVETRVLAWGVGGDYLLRITDRKDGSFYLLAGGRLDGWASHYVSGSSEESSSTTKLGLRAGAGLRLGPVFGEVRYRITYGDLRYNSSDPRQGGAWSAVEAGVGVRF